MLYPQGTFVDDVIVHRLGEDDFLLVITPVRARKISIGVGRYEGIRLRVEELSDSYTQLAIQGRGG